MILFDIYISRERERKVYVRNLFAGGLVRDTKYIAIIQTKDVLWSSNKITNNQLKYSR